MEKDKEIPVYPLTDWNIKTLDTLQAIMQFAFVCEANQSPDQAQKSPNFLLNYAHLHHLRDALDRAIQRLDRLQTQQTLSKIQAP